MRNGAVIRAQTGITIAASMPAADANTDTITALAVGAGATISIPQGTSVTGALGAAVALNRVGSLRGQHRARRRVQRNARCRDGRRVRHGHPDSARIKATVRGGHARRHRGQRPEHEPDRCGRGCRCRQRHRRHRRGAHQQRRRRVREFRNAAGVCELGPGGSVRVKAQKSGTITAVVVAGSLSGNVGKGGSLAIGVAIADNALTGTVTAAIDDATVVAAADVYVEAISTARAEVTSVGVAVSFGASPDPGVSLSLAGAGAQSTVKLADSVTARIGAGAVVTAGQAVVVRAVDESSARAIAGAGSLSITFAGRAPRSAVRSPARSPPTHSTTQSPRRSPARPSMQGPVSPCSPARRAGRRLRLGCTPRSSSSR